MARGLRAGVDALPGGEAPLHESASRVGLYWRDRNLKFHRYDHVDPNPDVESLLAEVDADPTCIFWG